MMALRVGRWRFSVEGICTIGIVVLLAYVLWPSGAQEAREQAYEAERMLRRQRNALLVAQTKTDTVTRYVTRADARLGAQHDSLTQALAWADSVRVDVQSSNADLRVALDVAIRRSQTFQVAALALRDSVRELIAAHALERLAVNRTLIAADSAVKGWQGVADAERRKGWRRFTQGAFVGGIVTLLAVVML